ncbi:hypothetical protein MYSE111917_12065 [Mycobacterium senriense]
MSPVSNTGGGDGSDYTDWKLRSTSDRLRT